MGLQPDAASSVLQVCGLVIMVARPNTLELGVLGGKGGTTSYDLDFR
jgi:hypothetical protein